jgi:hypothetical protein
MKRTRALIAFSAILSFSFTVHPPGQQVTATVWLSAAKGDDSLLTDVNKAQHMLNEIMDVVGLAPNFELKEAKVDNIQASISHRKRYILFNPEFINKISQATGNQWAAKTLLAHEVGHHLNGHTIKRKGSTPKVELEADEFAGFVLFRLGASLNQAQEVMEYIATSKKSSTHPAKASRLAAIKVGWQKAAEANATLRNSSSVVAAAKGS